MRKLFTHPLAVSLLPSSFQSNIFLIALTESSLLQSESEESLQMAVTQIFREFGPVYVKIRRDAKQMPFAFCQYTVSASYLVFIANI